MRLALALATLALVACKKDPPVDAAPVASASASASAVPSALAAPATHTTTFNLLATTAGDLAITGLAKDVALVAAGPLLYRLTATAFEQDPALLKNVRASGTHSFAVYGAWPDVYAVSTGAPDKDGNLLQQLFKWSSEKAQWTPVQLKLPVSGIAGVFPWKDGHVLAAVKGDDPLQGTTNWAFRNVEGKGPLTLAAPTTSFSQCSNEVLPLSAVGFATGEVFVAGLACAPQSMENQAGSPISWEVERWDSPGKKSEIQGLGDIATPFEVFGPSAKQTWIRRSGEGATLLHYDGFTFKPEKLPEPTKGVIGFGFEGEVPLLGLGAHLYRQNDAGWQLMDVALAIPDAKKPEIQQIAFVGGVAYLVVVDGKKRHLLGAVPAPKTVAELPTFAENLKGTSGLGFQTFDVATSACTSIVVPLQAGGPTTKFPKVAAALEGAGIDGLTFVIDDVASPGMLEAKAPSFEAAEKLVALMKEKAKPTIAKVLCRTPKEAGTVTF